MAKNWIGNATKNAHGQFRAKAERAGKSTEEFAREHAHDKDKTGKQARLALTLMGERSAAQKLYPRQGKK